MGVFAYYMIGCIDFCYGKEYDGDKVAPKTGREDADCRRAD